MPTKKPEQCIVADCPAQRRRCGCGFLATGTPCRHPQRREEWEQKIADEEVTQCSEQD